MLIKRSKEYDSFIFNKPSIALADWSKGHSLIIESEWHISRKFQRKCYLSSLTSWSNNFKLIPVEKRKITWLIWEFKTLIRISKLLSGCQKLKAFKFRIPWLKIPQKWKSIAKERVLSLWKLAANSLLSEASWKQVESVTGAIPKLQMVSIFVKSAVCQVSYKTQNRNLLTVLDVRKRKILYLLWRELKCLIQTKEPRICYSLGHHLEQQLTSCSRTLRSCFHNRINRSLSKSSKLNDLTIIESK